MASTLRRDGQSLRQIAETLTERGIKTAKGGQWSAAAVRSVLLRFDADAVQ